MQSEGPAVSVEDNSKEADLLNWNTSAQNGSAPTAQVTEDMNLLDIGGSGGMKKDPSNFDLLSGFGGGESAAESASVVNSGEATTSAQENLFDPFSTSPAGPQVSGGQPASENLLGQFSAPQPQQANPFGQFGGPVSWTTTLFSTHRLH